MPNLSDEAKQRIANFILLTRDKDVTGFPDGIPRDTFRRMRHTQPPNESTQTPPQQA